MARLFSYLMTHDSGFAPNPFHQRLTLATCKPGIRRTKIVGDWVAGFASKALVNNSRKLNVPIEDRGLVFFMKISQVVPLERYFICDEFQCKKPSPIINKYENIEADYGDNIYSKLANGEWQWLENENHDEGFQKHDTDGINVLVSDQFWYFGRKCTKPSGGWEGAGVRVPVGPTCYGYQSDEVGINNILDFVKKFQSGVVHGSPCLWGNTKVAPCGR